jgi:hypothetical protein
LNAPKVRVLVPDVVGLMTHGLDRMNAVLITVGTWELNHTKLKSLACALHIRIGTLAHCEILGWITGGR